jgi:Family of unknown function (DUF6092)
MPADGDRGLFEFVLYLVSCSRLSLEEPPIYGSFRLIEGASRLIEMLDPEGTDAFLSDARRRIEEHKLMMVDRHEEYTAFLDDLLRDVVAEARARGGTSAARAPR